MPAPEAVPEQKPLGWDLDDIVTQVLKFSTVHRCSILQRCWIHHPDDSWLKGSTRSIVRRLSDRTSFFSVTSSSLASEFDEHFSTMKKEAEAREKEAEARERRAREARKRRAREAEELAERMKRAGLVWDVQISDWRREYEYERETRLVREREDKEKKEREKKESERMRRYEKEAIAEDCRMLTMQYADEARDREATRSYLRYEREQAWERGDMVDRWSERDGM